MKIAVVIQRYGLDITGGAELHCRWIVERLATNFETEVLTTCARDYVTWKNEYPAGLTLVNGIPVRRFKTDQMRSPRKFDKLSQKLYGNSHTYLDEIHWMIQQGPYSSGLLNYIKENRSHYQRFLFYTYLYPTTYFGMQLVPEKSLFVPTAHDEPPIYFDIFKALFHLPRGIFYLTQEEKEFVTGLFNNGRIPHEVLGVGVQLPEKPDPEAFRSRFQISEDFILYAGRIDEGKGCGQLIHYFLKYKTCHPSPLKLILIGKLAMQIPHHPDIQVLGYVSDEDKFNAMKAATVLVAPSLMESLSIASLEAWGVGTPVLANEGCSVLKGHCIKSNAGLYYGNYEEFQACLGLLLGNPELRRKLGENGIRYIQKDYQWPVIEAKLQKMIQLLSV
ncbi:MAG TPA: glycosyltransferase family 4 protein [Candidatus Limnocylindrales bacterium]|nr:glycosyltransferase family 4 protein [Candidatus Limnocylindrales bacterium]